MTNQILADKPQPIKTKHASMARGWEICGCCMRQLEVKELVISHVEDGIEVARFCRDCGLALDRETRSRARLRD